MAVKPSVYLETSFISYLAGEPSRDELSRQRQLASRRWWKTQRQHFRLLASPYVFEECSDGKPDRVAARLTYLQYVEALSVPEEVHALTMLLLSPRGPLPVKANIDANHIAVATVAGVDYLLTWNLKHIANPFMRRSVDTIIRRAGYEPPIITTADQLLEGAPR